MTTWKRMLVLALLWFWTNSNVLCQSPQELAAECGWESRTTTFCEGFLEDGQREYGCDTRVESNQNCQLVIRSTPIYENGDFGKYVNISMAAVNRDLLAASVTSLTVTFLGAAGKFVFHVDRVSKVEMRFGTSAWAEYADSVKFLNGTWLGISLKLPSATGQINGHNWNTAQIQSMKVQVTEERQSTTSTINNVSEYFYQPEWEYAFCNRTVNQGCIGLTGDFREHPTCITDINCPFLLRISHSLELDRVILRISSPLQSSHYVSVGLSADTTMANTLVFDCIVDANSMVQVSNSFNEGHTNVQLKNALNVTSSTYWRTDPSMRGHPPFSLCVFRLPHKVTYQQGSFSLDFQQLTFHILSARGALGTGGANGKAKHNNTYVSAQAYNFGVTPGLTPAVTTRKTTLPSSADVAYSLGAVNIICIAASFIL